MSYKFSAQRVFLPYFDYTFGLCYPLSVFKYLDKFFFFLFWQAKWNKKKLNFIVFFYFYLVSVLWYIQAIEYTDTTIFLIRYQTEINVNVSLRILLEMEWEYHKTKLKCMDSLALEGKEKSKETDILFSEFMFLNEIYEVFIVFLLTFMLTRFFLQLNIQL